METKLKVYLAGGWFNPEQDRILTMVEDLLFSIPYLEVYSPRRKAQFKTGTKPTREMCEQVFNNNIEAIKNSDFVVASTEGKDMGTLIEIGAAYVLKKPVIAVYFNEAPFNLMAEGTAIGGVARNKIQLELMLATIGQIGLEGYLKELADIYRYQGLIE
jgi:nucleoside deoxyribosyltransferase